MWTNTRILSTLVLSYILHGVHAETTSETREGGIATIRTTVASESAALITNSVTQQVNIYTSPQQISQSAIQITQKTVTTDEPKTYNTVPYSVSHTLPLNTQTTRFSLPGTTTTNVNQPSDTHSTQPMQHTVLSTQSVTAPPTSVNNDNTAMVSSAPSPTSLNTDHTTTITNTATTNTTAAITSTKLTNMNTSNKVSKGEIPEITSNTPITNRQTTDNIPQPSNPSTLPKDRNSNDSASKSVKETTPQMIPTIATTFSKSSVTQVIQQTKMNEVSTSAANQVNKMTTSGKENMVTITSSKSSVETTERTNSATTTSSKSSVTTTSSKSSVTTTSSKSSVTTTSSKSSVETTERTTSVTKTSSKSSTNEPGIKEKMQAIIDGSETGNSFAKTCAKFLIQNKMGKCNMSWVVFNNGSISIKSINIEVDEAMANKFYSDFEKEKHDDEDFPKTLVAIVASCGTLVLILLAFAMYCSCHCKSYRKNQQPLTEELQTVENGYHDNPTLEVMEVQPEMQEKKLALNGEFNDSWIVPFDNLIKEDILDEEDTHL